MNIATVDISLLDIASHAKLDHSESDIIIVIIVIVRPPTPPGIVVNLMLY